MDFFSHQAAARRQTRRLVLAFIVAVAAVVLALDIALFTLFASSAEGSPVLAPLDFAARNPGLAVFCTLLGLAIIGMASVYKAVELRGGGGVVARSLGGVRVERDTSDFKRKRLYNVVEEMAIASGVPMPEIYVLEQESGINAFAAGHTPANAAVAVTQGALDRLDREQLQGVIAHEFSHILNGDMRLNIQLLGWVFGLFAIALIGRTILRGASRARRGAEALAVAAVAMVVLGYVGLLAGRILQAAVSRQRERLADASAVQFTRNPLGLKEALVRIAGSTAGSRIVAADAEHVAHMLFAPGLKRVFATHPPILERIRTLDPGFDARDLDRAIAEAAREELKREKPASASGRIAAARPPEALTAPAVPSEIAAQVGSPETVHVRLARELRVSLPESLRELAGSAGRARDLVIALVLSRHDRVHERQIRLVEKSLSGVDVASINEATEIARGLAPMLRLPALLQIFPALRRLSLMERRALAELIEQLIHADARVEVFEYCLATLLKTLLNDEMEARAPHGALSLEAARQPIHLLFAVLARAGARDEQEARRAYEAGMQSVFPMRRPDYAAYPDWPQRLDRALPTLEKLHPFAKQAVIEGLVRTVAHDDMLNVSEAELLRTVCALLHCPLPPIVPRIPAAV